MKLLTSRSWIMQRLGCSDVEKTVHVSVSGMCDRAVSCRMAPPASAVCPLGLCL